MYLANMKMTYKQKQRLLKIKEPMLVLFLGLVICNAFYLPSTRFHVANYEFIQLCAGEPCEWLNFRINRTLDGIWIHNQAHILKSQTYYRSPNGAKDSELFYFDRFRLRLHLTYRLPPPNTISIPLMAFDGTIGLGKRSEIWAYWDNYTLSTSRLQLGGYDRFAQRYPFINPPILDIESRHAVVLGDGTAANIRFDLSRVETLVPYGSDISNALSSIQIRSENCSLYYEALNIENVGCSDETVIPSDGFQYITLTNGIHYQSVLYSEDDSLVVGTHFIDELVVFEGISCHCLLLAEDAFSLDYVTLMASVSLLLFLLLSLWLVIAESPADRQNEWEFKLMMAVEVFSYIVDILIYYTVFRMVHWTRYLSQYAEIGTWPIAVILPLLFALSVGTFIRTTYPWINYTVYLSRFRVSILTHVAVFSLLQMSFVWLALAEQHETNFNRILLAIVLSVSLILGFACLILTSLKRQTLKSAVIALSIFMTTCLLILYTLIPMFRYADTRHSFVVSVIAWLLFLVFMPAMMLTTTYQMNHFRKKKH